MAVSGLTIDGFGVLNSPHNKDPIIKDSMLGSLLCLKLRWEKRDTGGPNDKNPRPSERYSMSLNIVTNILPLQSSL